MTEPNRPDDDLVNAVLDGEATPDERARVLGDPDLRDRLEELTRVRDLVAAAVAPPDEATRDEIISRAIAAGRRPQAEHRGEPDRARVVPLRARRPGMPGWLAAAAVIVVLLVGGALLASIDRQGDDSASVRLEAADSGGGGGDEESAGEAGDDPDAAATADSSQASEPDRDLGAVADDEELRQALGPELGATLEALDEEEHPPTTGTQDAFAAPGDARACAARVAGTERAGPRRLFHATYAGVPAVVYVFGRPETGVRVTVVSADACATLSTFTA